MSVLFNMPWQQAFDSSGNTLGGAKLYFFQAGTSTPATVYADVGLGVPLSNPVIANGAGRFEPIYLDNGMYKAVLKTSEDVMIWTADNIQTTSEETDVSVVTQAITQTSISAGYTAEEAQNPTNFVKSIYKYANSGNWFVDSGVTDNTYILTGLDDYTRLSDYFLGQNIWFVSSRANTGAATVNADSIGTKNIIRADGTSVLAGDVYGLVHLVYNGVSFVIQDGAPVYQRGDQTVYDVKTFDESPVMPKADFGDNSTAPATTSFLKDALESAFKPRISDAVSVSATTYTALKNGIFYLTPSAGSFKTAIYIDGTLIMWHQGHAGSSHGQPNAPMTIILGKGQVMKVSSSLTSADETRTYQKGLFVPYGNYNATA